MKSKNIGTALLALAFLGGSASITACSHPSPEKRAEWMASKLSGKLDLNDAQKLKLDAVKVAFLDARKAHESDRAKSVDDFKQLVLSEKLDPAKLKAMIAQKKKSVDDSFDSVFPRVAEFHASLTPEQKQKAVELIDKFSHHFN